MTEFTAVEARLGELGLALPAVAAPVAAYVPAVQEGSLIFASGQLPFINGRLPRTGLVGHTAGVVSSSEAVDLARICVLNAMAAIKSCLGDLDKVRRIIRLTGYVASEPSFSGQADVVDGASLLLCAAFGDAGIHVRSSVGVPVLPLNAPVEIELTVAVRH